MNNLEQDMIGMHFLRRQPINAEQHCSPGIQQRTTLNSNNKAQHLPEQCRILLKGNTSLFDIHIFLEHRYILIDTKEEPLIVVVCHCIL